MNEVTKLQAFDEIADRAAIEDKRLKYYKNQFNAAVTISDYDSAHFIALKMDSLRIEFFDFVRSVVDEVEEV